MQEIKDKIIKYIDSQKENIINDFSELCRIPSVSAEQKDGFIFGKEVENALYKCKELFAKEGISLEIKNGGYALGEIDGEGAGIGIFTHADVVPVNAEDWIKTKPFEPLYENGFLYARGADDDKNGIICALYALKALKNAGIKLKKKIVIYIGGSEETGMQDLCNFVACERMPEVSIVPDGDFPIGIGEKGILRMDMISDEKLSDIINFEGGEAYNVVLDAASIELKNGEKKEYQGISAHASRPQNSINAAIIAIDDLMENADICDSDKRILGNMKKAVSGYYGENIGINSEGALGKLTSANGMVKIIDSHLFFTLDIRYGVECDSAELPEKVREYMKSIGFSASVYDNDPGYLIDENSDYIKAIISACEDITGEKNLSPKKMAGGTYARKLRNAYSIACETPWSKELLGLPSGHGSCHQSDEAESIEDLLSGIKCIALMLINLDLLSF